MKIAILCLVLVVEEISCILNTGLERDTIAILGEMCANGVNPEALADGFVM